jgi:hypothetical protein
MNRAQGRAHRRVFGQSYHVGDTLRRARRADDKASEDDGRCAHRVSVASSNHLKHDPTVDIRPRHCCGFGTPLQDTHRGICSISVKETFRSSNVPAGK